VSEYSDNDGDTRATRNRTPHSEDLELSALLTHLRNSRGFDFSGYKPVSLRRRVIKRMQSLEEPVETFAEYLDYLEVHPEEFAALFNSILINVTSFFRDPEAWKYLANEVVPEILRAAPVDAPVRCWSAGCASGEEPNTLAMVLAEAMGEDAFRRRVKIYATDVDEQALAQARQAIYSEQSVRAVPPEYRNKYFQPVQGGYQFAQDLRRNVIYGRHDLVQDAPISRLDLLVSRNTLMYFNAETQARILNRFHFALKDTGFLFLGRAEMLLTHTDLFEPVNLKHRVFTKAQRGRTRQQLLQLGHGVADGREASNRLAQQARLREAAFDATADAILVVDVAGKLLAVNQRAREMLGLRGSDLGRPLRDLEVSYHPVELRGPIDRATATRGVITIPDVERYPAPGMVQYLEVYVTPISDDGGPLLGVSITMTDVTRYRRLEQELQRSHSDLESAYEELQSTNEELETSNEELQSTIEELETTNEELESTNEELETTNAELLSTNEELATMNSELGERTAEANMARAFLESILSSLESGLVVIDDQLNVLIWNRKAEDLWGLRYDEVVGRSLLSLDIGLPVERLAEPLRAFSRDEQDTQTLSVDAITRRGKPVRVTIVMSPFSSLTARREGIVLQMVAEDR